VLQGGAFHGRNRLSGSAHQCVGDVVGVG
jgi:hypothetical protein